MKKTLVILFFFALVLVSPLLGQTIKLGGVIKDDVKQGAQHQFKTTTLAKITTLDSVVDLSAYAPIPMDQGGQGSCASCAVAGLVGMMENLEHGYSVDNTFSPSFLFNLVNYNGTGSTIGNNLSLICEQGIPRITEFPYHDTGYSTVPSLDVFKSALTQRGLEWYTFTGGDTLPGPIGGDPQAIPGFLGVNTARALLAAGTPLVLTLGIKEKFNESVLRAENWVFSWAGQDSGNTIALHAVYVIGYNDSLTTRDGKGAFRIRMSSGPNHFDHGDLWVTYQAIGLWQMVPFHVISLRHNYQPELTVETDWNMQYLGDNFESGFKVNGQTHRQWILWWATGVPMQLLYKKLPDHLPMDLTDLSSKIGNAKSFTYFIKGAFRPSKFGPNHPKIIKLHVLDSLKGIDIVISANLTINDSLFYAEWPVTITDVADNTPSSTPVEFSLLQNYPNPFNPTTAINFSIAKSGHTSLKVYNLLGQEVAILIDKDLNAGAHNTKFDAGNLSSGIYIYVLKTSDYTASKKMILMK